MKKLLLSSAAIIFGGCIYVFYRSESLMMFRWFSKLHIDNFVKHLRNAAEPYANSFPYWFYYSLPNALWLFSGILLFYAIWEDKKKYSHQRILWITLFVFLAIGSEIAQYFAVIPGTFDITDLLLMFLAWFIAIAFINRDKNFTRGKEHERRFV